MEEAVRFADVVLTIQAFQGTTNDPMNKWKIESIRPMIHLCEEINPNISCPLDVDEVNELDYNDHLVKTIVNEIPKKCEGFVISSNPQNRYKISN